MKKQPFIMVLMVILLANMVSAAWTIDSCNMTVPLVDQTLNIGQSFTFSLEACQSGEAGGFDDVSFEANFCTGTSCTPATLLGAATDLGTANTNPISCGNSCKNACVTTTWTVDANTAGSYILDGDCETTNPGPTSSNVSINVTVNAADLFPRMNASINNTAPLQDDVVNISANVSDDNDLSFCQFITNETGSFVYINVSVEGVTDAFCSQNFTVGIATDGVINYTVRVNNSINQFNQSEFLITVQATPIVGDNNVSTNVTLFLNELDGDLTVTYNSLVNITFEEINGTANVTLNTTTQIVNMTKLNLSAGSYNITAKIDQNDSVNSSFVTHFLTILKNTTNVTIIFSPSSTETYSTETTVTCTANNDADILLHRNGTVVPNPDIVNLSAGLFNYTCNTTGDENVTSFEDSGFLTVNKGTGAVNLLINQTDADFLRNGTRFINVSTTLTTGNGTIRIERNGSAIANGTSEIHNVSIYTPIVILNFTVIFEENENWTGARETHFLNLTDRPPNVTLESPFNGTVTNATIISFNCSGDDDVELLNVTLYHNDTGVFKQNGSATPTGLFENVTFVRQFELNSTIKWNCEFTDNTSQSSFASDNFTLTLNQTFPVPIPPIPPPEANVVFMNDTQKVFWITQGGELHFTGDDFLKFDFDRNELSFYMNDVIRFCIDDTGGYNGTCP